MNASNTYQTAYQTSKEVMNFEPNQYPLMNKVQLMLAYNPNASDLYSRVKSMKVFDAEHRSLSEEVQSLNADDFKMVGQILNLFRI